MSEQSAITPSNPGATSPAGAPLQATPPAVAPPAPSANQPTDNIQLTTQQLAERLERAKKSELKALFGEADPKKELEELARLRQTMAEAERAKLTEAERVAADLKRANDAQAQALEEARKFREEAGRAKFEADVSRLCLRLGISNYDYAMFLVDRAKGAEGFKLEDALKAFAEDPAHKGALGISVTAPPLTNTPSPGREPGTQGPTPPPGTPGTEMKPLTDQEWQNQKARWGI